ncbi:MAG: hypothetical protein LBL46_00415 [Rickettsiales bacterium]|jgi:hypothetical protein|nr:hypothetical protein [Rickettsiales bacterium]
MKKFNLQSAKFNCGARKGISAFGRLSLNFAICTLLIGGGEADAAKMCQYDIRSGAQYFNAADGSFVIGACTGGSGPQTACSGYSHTGTYGGTGAPANYNCSAVRVAGVSACVDGPQAGKKGCACKMTYPYESVFIITNLGAENWGGIGGCGGGRATCPEICACHIAMGSAPKTVNAAVGGMI